MIKRKFYGLTGTPLNVAIGTVAGTGFLLFGYDQGVMGSLLTLPAFVQSFPSIDTINTTGTQRSKNSTLQGLAIALYEIGCLFGALAVMKLGDILGRRKTIFWGAVIMTIGGIIQCTSFSLAQLITGRIITGIGNGFITSTVPIYQSECSKSHRRGQLVMIAGALITGGICISYWIDFAFFFVAGEASWRVPLALQNLFSLVIICTVMNLPESPRWLVKAGKREDAFEVIAALDGVPREDPMVTAQVIEIEEALSCEGNAGLEELFIQGPKRNFHRTLLGFVNQMFQQISGINLITYYAATIYEQSIGLTPFVSRIVAAANGTEYFAASWIAVFTIERIGRRKMMIFGAIGQAISMAVLAACTSQPKNEHAAICAAVFLFVFNTFFAVGWLGMTWLYPAEIAPLRIRASANGLSTASNWIFNFLVVMITPVAFANITYRTYIIFAVINGCLILPVVYWFYPETAYRSLEEMDAIFTRSKGWTDCVKIAKEMPYRHGKDGRVRMDYVLEEYEVDAWRRDSKRRIWEGDEK